MEFLQTIMALICNWLPEKNWEVNVASMMFTTSPTMCPRSKTNTGCSSNFIHQYTPW
uniref:Uncharacterized protein n=1 Tax=Arion vulgaris TaxID=1028688 RepID=A0A0B6ZWF0_9EUPU